MAPSAKSAAARRTVISLEHDRKRLAQTLLYVHRNVMAQSYSLHDGQRILTAAMQDLEQLDQNLFVARLAQTTSP
ncbi:hypothetical protein [Arthrobacter sp. CAN_A1]|uniref:hypothetical protein n=1 Tax=Arthrobacter sp. CAN_A1 TaxID=2787717 RepID=UPI0018C9C5C3